MWPLKSPEYISIIFTPQRLICCWIKTSNNHAPLRLVAYQTYSLNHLELEKLIIFNPTSIKKHIQQFLKTYQLKKPFINFALVGPGITEKFVHFANVQPIQEKNVPLWQWQYCYLYPHDTGSFVYYTCAIQRSLLLQYQLLATTSKINLIKITTQRMTLLHLYRYMWGTAFRQSQLAIHMLWYNNMIEQLFSIDTLARILHVPNTHSLSLQQELLPLLTCCGLFVSERFTRERH